LELQRIAVVYPGSRQYLLSDQIEVVPFQKLVAGGRLALFPGVWKD